MAPPAIPRPRAIPFVLAEFCTICWSNASSLPRLFWMEWISTSCLEIRTSKLLHNSEVSFLRLFAVSKCSAWSFSDQSLYSLRFLKMVFVCSSMRAMAFFISMMQDSKLFIFVLSPAPFNRSSSQSHRDCKIDGFMNRSKLYVECLGGKNKLGLFSPPLALHIRSRATMSGSPQRGSFWAILHHPGYPVYPVKKTLRLRVLCVRSKIFR